jgi:hypothetical protein
MRTRIRFLTVALAAGVAAPLAAQQRLPPVGVGRAAGQTAAGLVGMPIGFLAGGLSTRWVATHWLGASDDRASSLSLAGAFTGAAVTTAAGPALVGAGPHAHGSYWGALAGSAAGGVGSFLLVRLNRAVDLGTIPRFIGAIVVVALPAVGATAGYGLTRQYR